MKKFLNLLWWLGLSIFLLSGCYKTESASQNTGRFAVTTPTVDSSKFASNSNLNNLNVNKPDDAKNLDRPQTEDCTRAVPESIVKKSVFLQTTFKLSEDKRTGTETVTFPNGDKLIITNAGCEYYYLSFRFESKRFSARTNDTKYWFKRAVELIEETESGISDAPIQMKKAAAALENYLKKTNKPQFGEEIDYGGKDIRTFLTVKKVQKLSKGRFALEINFAVGPL